MVAMNSQDIEDEFGDRAADGAHPVLQFRGGLRLVREVEPHHGDVPIGTEHHIGGLRVGIDVEFRRRRDVTPGVASPHRDDFLHPLYDARFLAGGECDVGVGTDGYQRDGLRLMRHDRVDDEVDGMPPVEIKRGGRQHGAVEPGIAMNLEGQHLVDDERAGRALRDRHLDAISRAYGQRIARGVLDIVVARNRGDAEKVDARVAGRQQDGDGIVVPRIAVQNDLFHG